MDKMKINNQIVLMRKHVKQAKVHIINKLVKEVKLLQNRKGNEAKVQKAKRKADRYLEEVILLKKIKPDYVSKLALSKAKNWKDVLAQKSSTLEDRSLAILANYSAVQKEVEMFHSCNQNLVTKIPDLLKEWEERSKLPKPPKFKGKKVNIKKFSNSVNFSHSKEILLRNKKIMDSVKEDNINSENNKEVEESLSNVDESIGMAKKKIISNKRKIENKPRHAETQNKHTPHKNSKKIENRFLENMSSDENIENSDEDSEMTENKYDGMAEKKMIPSNRKIGNKKKSSETQNKHTSVKNTKKVENRLLEDTSIDENSDEDSGVIENKYDEMAEKKMIPSNRKAGNKTKSSDMQNKHAPLKNSKKVEHRFLEYAFSDENIEDSETTDESDDEAIEDKHGEMAKRKMIPNKSKQRPAEIQNKHTSLKNSKKVKSRLLEEDTSNNGNMTKPSETQNKLTYCKNSKKVDNRFLVDAFSDENIEDIETTDESDDEVIEDKHGEMVKRKMILNKNKQRPAETQNTLTPIKNSKMVENLSEEVSSDENEVSEMIDEADSDVGENYSTPDDSEYGDDDVDNNLDNDPTSNDQNNRSRKSPSFNQSINFVKPNKIRKLSDSQTVQKPKIPLENNLKTITMLNLDDLEGLDEIPVNKKTEDEEPDDEEKEKYSSKKISDSFFLRPDEFDTVSENKRFDQPRQKKSVYVPKPENEHKMNRFERRNGRPKRDFQKTQDNPRFQKRGSSNFDQDRGFRKKDFSPKNQEWFQNRERKEFHSRDQKGFNKGGQNNFPDFRKQSFTEKSNKRPFIREDNSSFRENKVVDKKGNNRSDKPLHPSWEAKRKQKELTQASFQGKKIVFDN